MTEPPRPPGDGSPDPTAPLPPPPGGDPAAGYTPPPPHGPPPSYGPPPPVSGAGGYPPPPSPGTGSYAAPPSFGPGGYGPPPGGPPIGNGAPFGPPGFGSAGHPGAPAGHLTSDDRTWAMLAHFGGVLLGFLAPLIVMLAKGGESPTVRAHAVEALNFQLTWGVATIAATIIAACSFGILFFLPFITLAVLVVLSIIGGVQANDGRLYRYPMTVRLVK